MCAAFVPTRGRLFFYCNRPLRELSGLEDLYDFYDGQSARNAELILLRKSVLAAAGQGMVTLSTECGGSLGVTYLEVQSLRGSSFVLFNTHLCFNNPAQHAIQVVDTLAARYPGLPAVVMGDLNARQGSDTMNFLLDQGELQRLCSDDRPHA